ncbi:MAG: chemotaxis protein CheW [Limnothrix sp.]
MTVASSTQSSILQHISFSLSGEVQGMILTTQLTETINLELGQIVQIPDCPSAVVGVCGWRGEVLWLVDLAYALGLSPLLGTDYQSAKCSLLRVSVNQQAFGVLVAQVGQLVRCDRQDIIPEAPSQLEPTAQALIAGQFSSSQGKTFLCINLEALLETLRDQSLG